MPEIITTSDGSHTLYVPELDEHYHSVHGAIRESMHIFIGAGYEAQKSGQADIFEIGFGTGLNAFLTALRARQDNRPVRYTAIEKYPLGPDITGSLNYCTFTGEQTRTLFDAIHTSPWDRQVDITSGFSLLKIQGDLTSFRHSGTHNLIYFDAFGPDKQPEMWSQEVFETIASITVKGGILVTYSAKGEVKRNLRDCGFEVSLLPGPPGKRQIIRAVKIQD